ncbi:hypothetical protein Gohar_027090, partial [Gossypium harknessii]|nr:hypothetical protein [Gossypium harknessii]
AEDQILETYIHNLTVRALCVIEQQHLKRHALVERWRLETHTFHLLYGECKITLTGVALQLSLLVDGPLVTRVVGVGDWSAICEQLLGNVPNKFFGSWIKMKWLEGNFNYIDNSVSVVEKEQYAQAFILRLIGGFLMPNKS